MTFSAPDRLVEVKVVGADGVERVLSRAEVNASQLVARREYLDTLWYADTQEFARARPSVKKPRVVLFGGRGVFPPSLKAAVRRLDAAKIPCRVIFSNTFEIPKDAVVVLPGGWAPSMIRDIGSERLQEFHTAKVLGICAGAYLLCSEVVWEGKTYPYPVGRADGRAVGPLPNIAPWPNAAALKLDTGHSVIYAGGAVFEVGKAKVRARYPDGGAAIIEMPGAILSGVHCEFNASTDADLLRDAAWPTGGGGGKLFLKFVRELLAQ